MFGSVYSVCSVVSITLIIDALRDVRWSGFDLYVVSGFSRTTTVRH